MISNYLGTTTHLQFHYQKLLGLAKKIDSRFSLLSVISYHIKDGNESPDAVNLNGTLVAKASCPNGLFFAKI